MASTEGRLTRPTLSRDPSSSLSASWSSMKGVFGGRSSKAASGTSTPITSGYSKSPSKPVSRTSSIPNSPELHGLLQRKCRPDLAAVNRALGELKVNNNPEHEAFIQQMEVMQRELETSADGCRMRLQRAMEARSAGRYEVCRGLCWEISINADADFKTRIYSYNILATLTDPIQARHWLDKSQDLVDRYLINDPETKKLNSIIAMLRQSRVAKHKEPSFKIRIKESNSMDLPRPAIPTSQPLTPGTQTPNTEKIIQWANRTPVRAA